MKKWLALFMFAAIALTFCACSGNTGEPVTIIESDPNVQIANPFVDYETPELAAKAVGFELKVPETVAGYSERIIQIANGKLYQVMYLNGDDRLIIRKEQGFKDISGDYNKYPEITDETIGSREVNLKGAEGKISCAVWADGDYTFAVTCDTPMDADAMRALIRSVE